MYDVVAWLYPVRSAGAALTDEERETVAQVKGLFHLCDDARRQRLDREQARQLFLLLKHHRVFRVTKRSGAVDAQVQAFAARMRMSGKLRSVVDRGASAADHAAAPMRDVEPQVLQASTESLPATEPKGDAIIDFSIPTADTEIQVRMSVADVSCKSEMPPACVGPVDYSCSGILVGLAEDLAAASGQDTVKDEATPPASTPHVPGEGPSRWKMTNDTLERYQSYKAHQQSAHQAATTAAAAEKLALMVETPPWEDPLPGIQQEVVDKVSSETAHLTAGREARRVGGAKLSPKQAGTFCRQPGVGAEKVLARRTKDVLATYQAYKAQADAQRRYESQWKRTYDAKREDGRGRSTAKHKAQMGKTFLKGQDVLERVRGNGLAAMNEGQYSQGIEGDVRQSERRSRSKARPKSPLPPGTRPRPKSPPASELVKKVLRGESDLERWHKISRQQ